MRKLAPHIQTGKRNCPGSWIQKKKAGLYYFLSIFLHIYQIVKSVSMLENGCDTVTDEKENDFAFSLRIDIISKGEEGHMFLKTRN